MATEERAGRRGKKLILLAALVWLASGTLPAFAAGSGDGPSGASLPAPAAAAASADLPSLWFGPRPAPQRPPLFFYLDTGVRDPVEQTLDDAEAAFRRGEEYYQAGHLEHARQEFDHAVDLLLTAPFSLRDDPRLQFGLDRLVDRIHQLELAALRDPAAGEEPPDVPAAIEEIPPLTFPLDPALRLQVEQELATLTHDLPVTLNERVLSVVAFFQTPKGRRVIEHGLRRAGRYRELITRILEEEGLPRDLIYLAQAESAFQPHARSRRRAVGLWQFISSRAQQYGLQIDWWVDERRDPVKSTQAAARHLHDLYQQFGDWYLAIAAYNCGPGCVARALQRSGGGNYWEMVDAGLLPRETRNYVPIILAVALVAKNPALYGVEVEPDPPLRFETVQVDKPTDLRRIAEAIGVDVSTLEELNPHLLHNVTPRRANFTLYVPPGTAETLVAELPRLPESTRVLWQQHRVRRGETLSHIAARYHTSAYAVAEANGIGLRSRLHPGDVLLIPAGGPGPDELRAARSAPRGERTYRVRKGDTFATIAARYGTTAQALAKANGLSLRSRPRVGSGLRIPARGAQAASAQPPPARSRTPARASGAGERTHRVRSGETLWELSRRYGVSVTALREANPFLSGRPLRAGDHLRVPE